MIFTRASIATTTHGLFGGLNTHCIRFLLNSFIIFFWSSLDRAFLSSLSAPIKLLPLIIQIILGCFLLALKRWRAEIKLATKWINLSPLGDKPLIKSTNSFSKHSKWQCFNVSFSAQSVSCIFKLVNGRLLCSLFHL